MEHLDGVEQVAVALTPTNGVKPEGGNLLDNAIADKINQAKGTLPQDLYEKWLIWFAGPLME